LRVVAALLVATALVPSTATADGITPPSLQRGATLAAIQVAAQARSRPGGGRKIWKAGPATSWSGQPQVLLVLGSARHRNRDWLHVLLPNRPNHSTGWIPRDNARLLSTHYWVVVDKHERTVAVYRRGLLVRRFAAVIGRPTTPTPDGLAAIYESDPQPDPAAFLGPWVLPLTVFSYVLTDYGGGPGRVAIHGRAGTSLEDPLGSARSHGCIRVDNDAIEWLAATISRGTPVEITG
jgi:lipoprotein-anchoring transpeptidase ErfK/SrfK